MLKNSRGALTFEPERVHQKFYVSDISARWSGENQTVFFHPSCKTRKCKNAERDFGSFPIARIPNKKKIIRFLYLALLGSQKYRKILGYLLTHDRDTWLLWLHYKVHQKALVGMC